MPHSNNHNRLFLPLGIAFLLLTLVACGRKAGIPRPYGYYRIDIPSPEYCDTSYGPYRFELNRYARLEPQNEPGEKYWADIVYPSLNARIHCSYKPVQHNLPGLTRDALEFVYKHTSQATAIPEREFAHPEQQVYGVYFTLEGNTASPYQFFLTDSTHHFFRGAAYCNCRPNADSLRPVLDYVAHDIEHLIETFRWTR